MSGMTYEQRMLATKAWLTTVLKDYTPPQVEDLPSKINNMADAVQQWIPNVPMESFKERLIAYQRELTRSYNGRTWPTAPEIGVAITSVNKRYTDAQSKNSNATPIPVGTEETIDSWIVEYAFAIQTFLEK